VVLGQIAAIELHEEATAADLAAMQTQMRKLFPAAVPL
jgi:hypothetical protein